jgi:pimeloyl-ACP methyl ester carboxylesterase
MPRADRKTDVSPRPAAVRQWQNSFYVAVSASARAALRCVTACLEDFRGDLATISIPVLVIHGD